MRRTDDCYKETDDQTYNYRKYCDNKSCFQTIQKPEIAVIFNKVQIKIFFYTRLYHRIIHKNLCSEKRAVGRSSTALLFVILILISLQ